MKNFTKARPSLATVNAQRAALGLSPVDSVFGVMRPGKTAKADKHKADANAAARAQANRDMKANRQKRK